jgi:hypothetical protein
MASPRTTWQSRVGRGRDDGKRRGFTPDPTRRPIDPLRGSIPDLRQGHCPEPALALVTRAKGSGASLPWRI